MNRQWLLLSLFLLTVIPTALGLHVEGNENREFGETVPDEGLASGLPDTVEVRITTQEVIKSQGRRVSLDATERASLHRQIRDRLEDLLFYMTLHQLVPNEDYPAQFDAPKYRPEPGTMGYPETIGRFLGLFPEELLDQPIIYNFFQPLERGMEAPDPAYLSPRAFADSLIYWFDDIRLTPLTPRPYPMSDEIYRYPRQFYRSSHDYKEAVFPLRFMGFCNDLNVAEARCPLGSIRADIEMNIIFELEELVGETETGEIRTHRIRYLDKHREAPPIDQAWRNIWAFANLHVQNALNTPRVSVFHSHFDALDLSSNYSTGLLGSVSLFFNDTLTVFGRTRLWDIGLDLGLGYHVNNLSAELGSFAEPVRNMNRTPVRGEFDLYGDYDLFISGSGLRQDMRISVLSVPVSMKFRRYLSPSASDRINRVNSIVLEAGVAYNLLLEAHHKSYGGRVSYHGRGLVFQAGFDPLDVSDLEPYGFGTFQANLMEDADDPFNPHHISLHLRLGLHLRQNRFSNRYFTITPWFAYSLTDWMQSDAPANSLGFAGELDHLVSALSSMKSLSFGIDLGISHNFLHNRTRAKR